MISVTECMHFYNISFFSSWIYPLIIIQLLSFPSFTVFDLKSGLPGASRAISFCFWFLFLLVFVHPSHSLCVFTNEKFSLWGGAGWEGIDMSLFLNYFLMQFLKEMFVCIPGGQRTSAFFSSSYVSPWDQTQDLETRAFSYWAFSMALISLLVIRLH